VWQGGALDKKMLDAIMHDITVVCDGLSQNLLVLLLGTLAIT
jgi:hypothetical protein